MGRTLLSKEEALRYSRNILLDGIGADGQMRLLGASVLIVGSGALGSVVAMYLAGSGIGRIGVADFDTVDISNLQRQLSFTMSDVGHPKAEALAGRIRMINPDIEVVPHNGFIDRDNVAGLISGYDYIVEAPTIRIQNTWSPIFAEVTASHMYWVASHRCGDRLCLAHLEAPHTGKYFLKGLPLAVICHVP